MVDPLSVVTAILTVVQLIRTAASTASQNKDRCQSLAHAGANDPATARVLERLKDAVGEALRLIQSCKTAGVFSGKYSSKKADDLDGVDKRINNCIMDLNLISQARTNNGKPAAAQGGVHVDYHSSYYQAQGGGASSTHVTWTPPKPQHAWGTPQPQSYYQQPPGHVQWVPGPAPYAASPAPSGSNNLSSLYTLPTVNKIFKRVFR